MVKAVGNITIAYCHYPQLLLAALACFPGKALFISNEPIFFFTDFLLMVKVASKTTT